MTTDDVFKNHQRKIAVDTMNMTDAGASIMGGMTKQEACEFLFNEAYQSSGYPGNAIATFLNKYWDWREVKSEHLNALLNQCRAIAGKHESQIHPMMFGMLQGAWKEFMLEQFPKKEAGQNGNS